MSKQTERAGMPQKTGRRSSLAVAVSGLVLAASLYGSLTQAQGPGDPGPGPQAPGQFPAQPGGPGQGPGQGPGGRGFGRMPFVMGKITGGDANNGIIGVASQFGGEQQVHVTQNTQFIVQKTVPASALQVNDQVQVQGVPTAITASTITAGQQPDFLRMGPFGGGGGGFGPRAGGGGPNQGNLGGRAGQTQAFASATGKVTATSPLTISISDNVSVVLKVTADTKLTKFDKTQFSNLKVGDTIIAAGQSGNDGSFTATGVGINISTEGGFGFGGPGGFGPGGFGPGGRGGRGGRGPGGQGEVPGGPDGPGAPPPAPPPTAPDR